VEQQHYCVQLVGFDEEPTLTVILVCPRELGAARRKSADASGNVHPIVPLDVKIALKKDVKR
jgi:hypothetical protein